MAPLDVLLRFHRRAATAVAQAADAGVDALEWLLKRDRGERSQWAELIRSTQRPFGVIVREVFERREHIWLVDEACRQRRGRSASRHRGSQQKRWRWGQRRQPAADDEGAR